MKRAFILLMDSFGIGEAPDAASFGDAGANTFLHIADNYDLKLPNLERLGLNAASIVCSGKGAKGFSTEITPEGLYGCAAELSKGKDTPSGHWEITGVPVQFEWGYFPREYPSFPQEFIDAFIAEAKIPGILGNCHASGTEIISKFGDESRFVTLQLIAFFRSLPTKKLLV